MATPPTCSRRDSESSVPSPATIKCMHYHAPHSDVFRAGLRADGRQHADTCPASQCSHETNQHEITDCTYCPLTFSWVWCHDCAEYCKFCECGLWRYPRPDGDSDDEEYDKHFRQQPAGANASLDRRPRISARTSSTESDLEDTSSEPSSP